MPISLPPDASPEHLRKQAKQLLKACRRHQLKAVRRFIASHPAYESGLADPAAVRLQEAQLVVAREYGFVSWTRLLQVVTAGAGPPADETDDSGILIMTNGYSLPRRANRH